MNYIVACHDEDRLPNRFYGPDWKTVCFNFARELSNAGKWKNIHRLLRVDLLMPIGTLGPDDYFWFPDPDLEFDDSLPKHLFDMGREYLGLDIYQPGLRAGSVASHPELIARTGQSAARRVEFCEIMCPCFSWAGLKRNLWTFDLNYSGFGIDLLWGKKETCYVLDWLEVYHPSSPGYGVTAKKAGFPDPMRELEEVRRLYL